MFHETAIKNQSNQSSDFEQSGGLALSRHLKPAQNAQNQKSSKKEQSLESQIKYQKELLANLCYAPVWRETVGDRGALIYEAQLPSDFLFRLETNLCAESSTALGDELVIKIFDKQKRCELKQLRIVKDRNALFQNFEEKRRLIRYVDKLPINFAVRPDCVKCKKPMQLVNPVNLKSLPFWGHTVGLTADSKIRVCNHRRAICGEIPGF